ncbi:acyltransferase domain-containing protein, partial [Streptomyces sp. NRRL S-15]
VIKMVMAMRHGVLPPTLHVDAPSSHVDWSAGAVALLTAPVEWPETDRPRRAGVSSFGVSGTNAHTIIEQAPAAVPAPAAPDPDVPLDTGATTAWVLSGRTREALRDQASRLLDAVGTADPAALAHALATTRTRFEHRAALVAREPAEFEAGLRALAADGSAAGVVRGTAAGDTRPVLVFPGQGAQWPGMAKELLDTSTVFAARLADCAQALAPHTDWSLEDVVRETPGAPGLDRVDVVQPVLWAVMVSLAELWRACGVRPAAVIGHSQGEIAAATVAGALSIEDAARVVALRSRALLPLSGKGGMASVGESARLLRERLTAWGDRLSVA